MKKIHLSNKDKKIAGVCGGIAEALGIDSIIIRLILILLSLPTIINGLIVYLIAWAVIPKGEESF